jgi:hypothetical protein
MGATSAEPVAHFPSLDAVQSLLIPGERLECHAIQRRLFALTHRRLVVGATSGRLIAVQRGLISGFTAQDIRWQDLRDAQLQVGSSARRSPSPPTRARTSPARRGTPARSGSAGSARSRRRRSIALARPRSRRGGRSAGCASWRRCAPGRAGCISAPCLGVWRPARTRRVRPRRDSSVPGRCWRMGSSPTPSTSR